MDGHNSQSAYFQNGRGGQLFLLPNKFSRALHELPPPPRSIGNPFLFYSGSFPLASHQVTKRPWDIFRQALPLPCCQARRESLFVSRTHARPLALFSSHSNSNCPSSLFLSSSLSFPPSVLEVDLSVSMDSPELSSPALSLFFDGWWL